MRSLNGLASARCTFPAPALRRVMTWRITARCACHSAIPVPRPGATTPRPRPRGGYDAKPETFARLNRTARAHRVPRADCKMRTSARPDSTRIKIRLRTPRGVLDAADGRGADAAHAVEFRPRRERSPCSAVGGDTRGEHRADAGQQLQRVGWRGGEEAQRIVAPGRRGRRGTSGYLIRGRSHRRGCGDEHRWRGRLSGSGRRKPARHVNAPQQHHQHTRSQHPPHPGPPFQL